MLSNTTGLELCLQKLEDTRAALPDLIQAAGVAIGENMVQALSQAAPQGTTGGPPPEGDAPGALADSFSATTQRIGEASVRVEIETSQPQKLTYVTKGTGVYGPQGQRIYPVVKQALYWPTAEHPYRSVAGQKPNDFVTPLTSGDPPGVEEELQTLQDSVLNVLEVS